MSTATAQRLAPGFQPSRQPKLTGAEECIWYSLNEGRTRCGFCLARPGDRERVLTVDLGASKSAGDAMNGFPQAPPYLPAPLDQAMSGHPPQIVTGLGDEAVAYYSPDRGLEGALIVFRAGNVLGKVRFHGSDRRRDGSPRTIARKTATDGAFRAAVEVARGLGVPARPSLTASSATTPPIRRVPKPCDTVPADVLDLLVPKATRIRGTSSLRLLDGVFGSTSDTCEWDSATAHDTRDRRLSVTLASAWRPGAGTSAATREYLRLHYAERDAGKGFTVLTGPGEQAFSVDGSVVFRMRDALVEVDYSGSDGDAKIPAGRATNGAYTAALRVAQALSD